MELVLLLQELQQEKTQQTLLSPLPFPTTLPLLSASVACNKTVVADPVRHLQCFAHDMLQTIVEMRAPPTITRVNLSELFVLRDLAVALSACIYQSLCDSDTAGVHKKVSDCTVHSLHAVEYPYRAVFGKEINFTNTIRLSQGKVVKWSDDEEEAPEVDVDDERALLGDEKGVTNLRALLAREKDEDTPRLNILLCEVFVATYLSLLVYAYATCDCHILYRLAGQKFTEKSWAGLFGGGAKKLLKMATSSPSAAPQSNIGSLQREDSVSSDQGSPGMWNAMRSITNQRMRLNMKILGQFGSQPGTPQIKEDKPTYREQFLSPEMSMVSYFLNKSYYEADSPCTSTMEFPGTTGVGARCVYSLCIRSRCKMCLFAVYSIKEDKPTYREQFLSPEMSMVSYFLNKGYRATID
ncbi:dmX-like protein 2 [Diaphorina citri]|uniref:DmX-like protein 2 n=1 Tax=Diaphorina citri TaxID=121845 RepID=A0A3Q0JD82_DIACI|nr:dmX-like protein 2 [Diaphorina citri]